MFYEEFKNWLKNNCPTGIEPFDFLEFCAMIGCLTIENSIKKEGITIDELIVNLFDKENQIQ